MNGFMYMSIVGLLVVIGVFFLIRFTKNKYSYFAIWPTSFGIFFGSICSIITVIIMSIVQNEFVTLLLPLLCFIFLIIITLISIRFSKNPVGSIRLFSISMFSTITLFFIILSIGQILISLYSLDSGINDDQLLEYFNAYETSEHTFEEYKYGLMMFLNESSFVILINIILMTVCGAVPIITTISLLNNENYIKIKHIIAILFSIFSLTMIVLIYANVLHQLYTVIISSVLIILSITVILLKIKIFDKEIIKKPTI